MNKTPIQNALDLLGERQELPAGTMHAVMNQIMDGEATPAQIGGLLMALKLNGETTAQITEAATVMRQRAIKVEVDKTHLIDTCGTGGDGVGIFNVSTAVAFIAASAGCRVAKHGNRSVSSSTGSADVLEAAGFNLSLNAQQVAECINQFNIGFLFAPAHHGATKYAVGPRKELAVRTMFNLLGPLTNPADTPFQVMGIFDKRWVTTAAEVLKELGSKHVMVVHSADGMDEISLAAPTHVAELKDGQITEYDINPEQFGLKLQPVDSLVVAEANESLALIKQALTGHPGPAADILALNAGAAIYVAGQAEDMIRGVKKAQQIMQAGTAWQLLQDLSTYTQKQVLA
ncbi:anthranilate phosphoribosyltransferase [Marinicella sp. S1101]|uniref:anthranilate phosphoribosyltransferase n=1 Tax=Marinicella marina TaxID=2996016 RepID=UPI002260BFEC|nr:anthranilate phosphoribosyltransferase [Marinicella marina]MCX7555121.1 anthranilate phosphoribosyltransferase [Marinicella marina]MDJ1140330.1 anthranilate phosphoribosyltransferase [Marinicella marina]